MAGTVDVRVCERLTGLCHCGKPLHYKNPSIEQRVLKLIDELGEFSQVTARGRTWLVPRHYLALHGLNLSKIEGLGFTELPARRGCNRLGRPAAPSVWSRSTNATDMPSLWPVAGDWSRRPGGLAAAAETGTSTRRGMVRPRTEGIGTHYQDAISFQAMNFKTVSPNDFANVQDFLSTLRELRAQTKTTTPCQLLGSGYH
jgi:hypothetical protein